MEKGFYHPERGYWQTVGGDPGTTILRHDLVGDPPVKQPVYVVDTYPAGTIVVPLKPGQDYEWVEGEWVHTPPTPEELRQYMQPLTARQFRLGLVQAGITEAEVAAAIAAMANDAEWQIADIEWRMAHEFERTHSLIVDLGASFGFTPEQVDDLWSYFLTI
jgi:hypothetical protein